MKGDKKKSSKFTVQSDCEEISENHQLDSSLDTEFIQEKKHRHYKSKYEHRRRKHLHRGNSITNDKYKKHCRHHRNRCEQKKQSSDHRNKLQIVTKQTIHVQKDNFKCIINLNTTVCDHKNTINLEKSQRFKNQDRPLPQCQKPLCHSSVPCETKLLKKESCIRPSIEKASRKEIEEKVHQHTSPSILDQGADHISHKSLENYKDIPMSYKYAVKHSIKYESKLEKLIKRTKERERKLVEQSRNNNNTSSPYTDISSGEFHTYSNYAASLHSRSTLILEPQPREIGSNESPIKIEKYSPTSFNKYFDSDLEMKIKSEFIMDSGAYSPVKHPMQKLFYNEEWIKTNIKSEPKEEKFRAES